MPARRSVEILRRLDWLIESDEFIQVVGFNGDPDTPLLSAAWNAVTVSHIDGAYDAEPHHLSEGLPHLLRPAVID